MRPGVPWSVKGIEPEAREAAKQAARRAGVTLGAWLNQVIMDTGTDEVGTDSAGSAAYRHAYAPPPEAMPQPAPAERSPAGVDLAPVAEAVREVVQRVENSERRTAEMTRRLEATVGQRAQRIDQSEHDMDDRYAEARVSDARSLDPLDRKLQQLHERMERAERARGGGLRPEDARTIQTLEKAVNAVVDHLDATERRTDETLSEIRQSLASLSDRVETAEEETEREEAKKRARALEDALMQLATRMEKMEHGVTGIGPQAVEAALRLSRKNRRPKTSAPPSTGFSPASSKWRGGWNRPNIAPRKRSRHSRRASAASRASSKTSTMCSATKFRRRWRSVSNRWRSASNTTSN